MCQNIFVSDLYIVQMNYDIVNHFTDIVNQLKSSCIQLSPQLYRSYLPTATMHLLPNPPNLTGDFQCIIESNMKYEEENYQFALAMV